MYISIVSIDKTSCLLFLGQHLHSVAPFIPVFLKVYQALRSLDITPLVQLDALNSGSGKSSSPDRFGVVHTIFGSTPESSYHSILTISNRSQISGLRLALNDESE